MNKIIIRKVIALKTNRNKLLFAIWFLPFGFCFLVFLSCQRVVTIDLNSSSPQYVIQAPLYEGTHDFSVTISQTTNYFSTDQPVYISNATVVLSKSDNSAPVTLKNVGSGNYVAANYTASNSSTYTLTVSDNGNTFVASSYMNKAVQIDSLIAAPRIVIGRNTEPDSFRINCIFKDPAGVANYYGFITIVNGVQKQRSNGRDLLVLSDRISDGIKVTFPIRNVNFFLKDSVEVQLLSLDSKMYDYFNTLNLIDGGSGGNSVAPTNPTSNWTNGALGYFGAFAYSSKTIIVK